MMLPAPAIKLIAALKPLLTRLESIPPRDRLALLACGVALVAAVEMVVIAPMAHKRGAVAAAGGQEAKLAEELAAKEATERQEQLAALQLHAKQLETELGDNGIAKAQGEPVSALLERALQAQAVRTVSLRALTSEALQPDAAAPETARALYRHRYELVLTGEVSALSASAAALETRLAPLRIERVRLLPDKSAALQLVVTFGLIGTERSWLNL